MEHLRVETNGVGLHAVVEGEGVAVLFCHGFPGLWYSWRHQIPHVARAGFRAIALDMRGYGRSARPALATDYANQTLVADLTGVLDALDVERAFFVGHDFGAQACWATALHAPERVLGVVSIAVPYGVGVKTAARDQEARSQPRGRRPSERYAEIAKRHFFHLHYFQKVGVAEAELGARPRAFLERIHWALSARGSLLDFRKFSSEGTGYLDVLAPPTEPLPWTWMTEEDLEYLVAEYMRAGPEKAFIGGLGSYRAMDVNWEHDPDYGRTPIDAPAFFLCGRQDPVLDIITPKSLETMPARVPNLRGTRFIDDAGHFAQQEQPEAVNEALLDFLRSELRR